MEYTKTRSIRRGQLPVNQNRQPKRLLLITGVGGFSIFEEAQFIGQGVGHVNDEPKAV